MTSRRIQNDSQYTAGLRHSCTLEGKLSTETKDSYDVSLYYYVYQTMHITGFTLLRTRTYN